MFRIGVWFPFLCILLAGCAGDSRYIGVPPIVTPDPIHRSDRRLIQNPPNDILAQFTFDAEGYIVDGPRSDPSEPVDHTALITNAVIADSFAKVALGTGAEFDYDFSPPGMEKSDESWEGKISKYDQDIGQHIYYRGGIITGQLYQSIDQSVKEISKNTGLGLSFQTDKESEVYFFYFFSKIRRTRKKPQITSDLWPLRTSPRLSNTIHCSQLRTSLTESLKGIVHPALRILWVMKIIRAPAHLSLFF